MTTPDIDYAVSLDWVDTMNAWRDVFSPLNMYVTREKLVGVNLVTNEHIATYQFGPLLAELSTGLFPVLGERPRRDMRVFGCTVRARHKDLEPGYGAMIEGDTMPEVLARWWDAAMTGVAYLALGPSRTSSEATAVLERWLDPMLAADATAHLADALAYREEQQP